MPSVRRSRSGRVKAASDRIRGVGVPAQRPAHRVELGKRAERGEIRVGHDVGRVAERGEPAEHGEGAGGIAGHRVGGRQGVDHPAVVRTEAFRLAGVGAESPAHRALCTP